MLQFTLTIRGEHAVIVAMKKAEYSRKNSHRSYEWVLEKQGNGCMCMKMESTY